MNDETTTRLEALQRKSKILCGAYIAYLSVSLFLGLAVESVTHEQLLNPEIGLFGLGIQAPCFFTAAPGVLLLLQLYFLARAVQYAGELARSRDRFEADEGENWTERLGGGLFTTLFLEPKTANRLTLGLANLAGFLSFYCVVPVVLLRIQWQLLPYHDETLTWVHRGLLILSLVAAAAFSWAIQAAKRQGTAASPPRQPGKKPVFCLLFSSLAALFVCAFSASVLKIPDDIADNEKCFEWYQKPFEWMILPFKPELRDEENCVRISKAYVRNLNVPGKEPVLDADTDSDADPVDGSEELLSPNQKLDLQGRDLRFGNFSGNRWTLVDLAEANLQGAVFEEADLQGASLREARLQGANLRDTQLSGADLTQASLQGADLQFAQLQGADLRGAQLQDADLRKVQLHGATLQGATLSGADLRRARLQGANLREAQLAGANMERTRLQGADLGAAQLQGADLRFTSLDGTDFFEADLSALVKEGAEGRQTEINLPFGPVRIRHSGQEQFKGIPSLSEAEILETRKEYYKPLLCKFPVLMEQRPDDGPSLLSAEEILEYAETHCPRHVKSIPMK
ncbi:MAG: pentapeptide repeat-containing protein [Nitrospinales bacterium]